MPWIDIASFNVYPVADAEKHSFSPERTGEENEDNHF